MPLNVSQKLITELHKRGLDKVFFVAGGNAMFLNDALRAHGIVAIPVHHEQSAAVAADAFSRASDSKIGVCLVTSGPGVTNLVTGLAGAYLDSTPMIAIIGQSKSELAPHQRTNFLRQGGLFEVDNEQVVKPFTKKFFRCTGNSNVETLVAEAVLVAQANRPGPVVIQVSLEDQNVPVGNFEPATVPYTRTPPPKREIDQLLHVFAGRTFKQPLILAGHGVVASRMSDFVLKVAERFQIPLVSTQLAKGVSPFSHPLFIGHPGPRGDRAANFAIQHTDLLICLGTSLSSQTIGYETAMFSPQSLKIIQDLGHGVSSKKLPLSNCHYFDLEVPVFLETISDVMSQESLFKRENSWIYDLQNKKESLAVAREPHITSTDGHNMYHFVDHLSGALSTQMGKVHVITDAGLAFYIMGQAFRLSDGHTYTVSGGLGSMGYALPALIGQSMVDPDDLCVAVSGDGSTQMSVQEFATLSAIKANAVYFVINNEGYASIRNTQDSFFEGRIGSSIATGVTMPDWKKISESYNLNYRKIDATDDLRASIEGCFSDKRPLLVEVICQSKQALMPSVPNYVDSSGTLRSRPLDQMVPFGVDGSAESFSFN